MELILELIRGVSRVFQKLIKFLNGAAISAPFVLSSAGIFLVIFTLDLEPGL